MPEPAAPLKVSVIIVSHNSAPALRRCLTALASSTARESTEVLVVDNGSHDESPRLSGEFDWVTFLKLAKNFGLTRARNIASRTATGEYLLYLCPSIEIRPNTVAGLFKALDERSDAAAAAPALVTPERQPVGRAYALPRPEELFAVWRDRTWPPSKPLESGEADWLPGLALAVRAGFVRGMNYFDEHYSEFWSDLDLCAQIRRAGKKILVPADVEAILHHDPVATADAGLRAVLSSDEALGAARFVSKYYGFGAGFKFRSRATFAALISALGATLRARDVGFHFHRVTALLSGQRVDGTQS